MAAEQASLGENRQIGVTFPATSKANLGKDWPAGGRLQERQSRAVVRIVINPCGYVDALKYRLSRVRTKYSYAWVHPLWIKVKVQHRRAVKMKLHAMTGQFSPAKAANRTPPLGLDLDEVVLCASRREPSHKPV
jgi:hypothetical protein